METLKGKGGGAAVTRPGSPTASKLSYGDGDQGGPGTQGARAEEGGTARLGYESLYL